MNLEMIRQVLEKMGFVKAGFE